MLVWWKGSGLPKISQHSHLLWRWCQSKPDFVWDTRNRISGSQHSTVCDTQSYAVNTHRHTHKTREKRNIIKYTHIYIYIHTYIHTYTHTRILCVRTLGLHKTNSHPMRSRCSVQCQVDKMIITKLLPSLGKNKHQESTLSCWPLPLLPEWHLCSSPYTSATNPCCYGNHIRARKWEGKHVNHQISPRLR